MMIISGGISIITERRSARGNTSVNHVLVGAISPGTYGDYWMLKDLYRSLDDDWSDAHEKKWKQLRFNTEFLEGVLAEYGELHCEYCGRPNLVIYSWDHVGPSPNMATADHFLPKSKYEHLSMVKDNMVVSCKKCNRLKDDNVWEAESIRHPYEKKQTILKTYRDESTREE